MGWGNCGTDSNGRPIGYNFEATCDHPGCQEKIDRGLSYVCGNMHGHDEVGCEEYFCSKHKRTFIDYDDDLTVICDSCAKLHLDSGDWVEDKNEGCLVRVPEGK